MHLTDKQCRAFKPKSKSYKKTDGNGLYMQVMPNGSKYWRMNYRFSGKSKTLAIGIYPETSLKAARAKREAAKAQLAEGFDPVQEKKKAKLRNQVSTENTFSAIAWEWFNRRKDELSKNYASQLESIIKNDLDPYLGRFPINEIKPPELLVALRTIEERGATNIAHRARQCCGQIFRYAVACGKTERDIAADLKGALKTIKVQNRLYLEERELPELFQKLDNYQGDDLTTLALRFIILTFVRTKELRGARWSEIDMKRAEWRIPAERMKQDKMHIVPLSSQAMSILDKLQPISGNRDLIFPNANTPTKWMSENTML